MKKIYVSNHLCRKKLKGEEPTTASGGSFVGSEVIRKGVGSTVWNNDH